MINIRRFLLEFLLGLFLSVWADACWCAEKDAHFDVQITLTAKPAAACSTQTSSQTDGGSVTVACDPAQFVAIEPVSSLQIQGVTSSSTTASTGIVGSGASQATPVSSGIPTLSAASTGRVDPAYNPNLNTLTVGAPTENLPDAPTTQKFASVVFTDDSTGNIINTPPITGQTNSVTAYRYFYNKSKDIIRAGGHPVGLSNPIEMFIVF